ncbi:unnamed protein product [Pedinophyceae sp. YPF-701]|nr:unnamed protein product [Pedinophyceae sp. YPF-701]
MLYGSQQWDPWRILGQILVLQTLGYSSLGFLSACAMTFTTGARPDPVWILSDQHVTIWTVPGMVLIACHAVNAALLGVYMLKIVERAKKVLDFSATWYVLHVGVCWASYGFPKSVAWWAMIGGCFVGTSLLGEWLCVHQELKDIPLASLRRKPSSVTPATVRVPGQSVAGPSEPGAGTSRAAPAPSGDARMMQVLGVKARQPALSSTETQGLLMTEVQRPEEGEQV